MVEGARLEIVCTGNVPRVRIPPSPLVLPTLARELRQARKGATVAVSSVWRAFFNSGE